MYKDIYEIFQYIFIAFIVWNTFEVVVNLVKLNFKGKRGILKLLKIIYRLAPAVKLVLMVFLIFKRRLFTSRVCFCDFKDAKLNFDFVKDGDDKNKDNYKCLDKTDKYLWIFIWYQGIFTGLFFVIVLYYHFKHKVKITFKS